MTLVAFGFGLNTTLVGSTNVVAAFDIELQAVPDVEIVQSVDVDVTTPDVDVEINSPVDVEVPS